MGQLLVRNVAEETIAALRARAARNGRSVEAEHRAILNETVIPSAMTPEKSAWIASLKAHRDETRGRRFTPSEVLVRESRDER